MMHPPGEIIEDIHKAAELIRSANYTVVLTGAGSSTPSGIPDFRSPNNGLWTHYSPMEVASLSAFRYQPRKFFDWLRPLAKCLVEAKPNSSHYAFSTLEKSGDLQSIITQNIDGLHQRAGSIAVIEVHGSLATLSCTGCFQQIPAGVHIDCYIERGEIPICPDCYKILKPDVVLFEEQLPIKAWLKAREAVESCDLMIIAGSSLTVTPVAELPLKALENNAKIILINLTPTYIDEYSEITLYGDVADIVPAIASEVTNV
jgi:NAD-dependent deacetylase